MFKIDVCKVCGTNCFWIVGIDGELAEKEVCSPECLAQLQSAQQGVHPTLLTPRPETVVTKQNILAALEAIKQSQSG